MPHEVEIHANEFEITLDQLVAMNNHREPDEALDQFGGLEKLASILHTDLKNGLSENIETRKKAFGANVFPEPKIPSFFALLLEALKDEMLIILIIAAVISLILGIFFPPENESGETSSFDRWEGAIEGSAILIAVAIVSLVQAINNYFQERQFQKLNKLKQDVQVKVQRHGLNTQCSIHDLVVGDVVILGTGNQVPADGFYISGYNCSCNQSDMTGESKPNKKTEQNKQLISGSYVMTGDCTMLVTAVGLNSRWGKALRALDDASDGRETPLQIKLGKLARYIGFVGVGVAAVVFVILFIYWLIDQFENFEWTNLELLVDNFIIAVTIVVVAVPEGLPLAVTMALAYSLMKMRGDMCLVRYLPACETMGGVTQICSDKTGTLTQNRMNVVQGILADQHFSSPIITGTNPFVYQLLVEGIARNSNSYLEPPKNPGGFPIYVGHPTECALLNWLNKLNEKYDEYRQKGPAVAYRIAFSSDRKRMSTLIPKFDRDHREDGYRLYTKGAPEVLLNRCVGLLDSDGHVVVLTDEKKSEYLDFIEQMASKGLRTLALCYRDFDYFDPPSDDLTPEQQSDFENRVENKLIFIGLTGIEDPVRPEVPDAVRSCITAGITVRMVTGDNLLTAKSIATQCGIWKEGYVAMEGEEFAQLTDEQLDKVLPKLVILARCMPTDKIRLVKRLKANKELVAVTGDGTNDAAALRGAHIGLAMGGGTEVARDASDIIILDDNFSSIVKAVMWGRSVFDNIRKFLQFQLTVNVSAMAIAALSALVNLRPLTAVQLLWVNLIMDSLGALALATERPTPALLTRPPKNIAHPKYSLLSPEMWKMIFGQAIYQIFVLYGALLLVGLFRNYPEWNVGLNIQDEVLYSLVFNSFIFCQLFNLVVCRKINAKEFNVFEKFFANWLFMAVLVVELVIQFFLVGLNIPDEENSFGSDQTPERIVPFLDWIGYLFSTEPLTWLEWLFCLAVGFVGFIWAFVLKLIPTPPEKIYKGEVGDIHGENSPLVDYIESQLEERPNHPLYTKPPAGNTILRTVSNQSLLRKSRSDISKSQPLINSQAS